MTGTIKLSVLNIDEEDIQFEIIFSNCICSTRLDFYGYADDFKDFGNKLRDFPQSIREEVLFELGEDIKAWAYYMLIKVFCYDASGHTAIKIIVDNHGDAISGHRSEFSIVSEAASINKLGMLLSEWDVARQKEISWESETS